MFIWTLPGMVHRDAARHGSSETLPRHVFLLQKPVNTKKVEIMEGRESQPLW
ncbi:hypothetical protein RchiOBHm_Chr2g0106041 [Rosa chinensis]|uniref:Uncharacterized protein n=1 Tax=Rosa chinensis TaxID=74649 RepID=A0A2P6RNK6_ROSCH|nr:hypothetical protein RchiOBHm_Chr2g0106041 [Rosa chinensis]